MIGKGEVAERNEVRGGQRGREKGERWREVQMRGQREREEGEVFLSCSQDSHMARTHHIIIH